VVSGTPGKKWEERIRNTCAATSPDVQVKAFSDIHYLHQWIKQNPVDMLIGNSYGKFVSKAESDLPFVRFGFPILDRIGHRTFPTVGYMGALRLLEKITDALFDHNDRVNPDHAVELI
ncbi:nitrogenase component 1, partial [Arthrospira platensis SPKY1]|nr:nitrogenase component 1 [Arthrospira platensis SPKY1]